MVTVDANLYNKMPDDIKQMFTKQANPGSDEVVVLFPNSKSTASNNIKNKPNYKNKVYGNGMGGTVSIENQYNDSGSAARFFYCAKSSKSERNKGLEGFEEKERIRQGLAGEHKDTMSANIHPTVKPVALMRYLVKLVTPVGGTVLDPFNGSGTTGIACKVENFEYIGIEREEEYVKISEARMAAWEESQAKLL